MGSWKDWQIGMIESGYSDREIAGAEARIKGTLADPLVRRLLTSQNELENLDPHQHGEQQIRC